MGLFSDFAVNLDDFETLQSIITDACNELKIPPITQALSRG
ncbi:hypothetical protein [Rhizobium sp. L43]|nr:hypothetical protein [Rhizobium sp. L43]